MGQRTVKRVPMDFDWPLKQTWAGYLLPENLRESKCPDCVNGATDAHEWLQKVAYVIAGLADDADDEKRGRPMHPYLVPLRDISYGSPARRPGPQFAEFADGIAPDVGGFMGRDVHRMSAALIKAAGLPDEWGYCPTCHGHSTVERYPGQRDEADNWEPIEPPTGDGWQLWETTSEGSPVSPVFASAEALADWCESGATWFGHERATSDEWLRSFNAGTTDVDSLLIVQTPRA